MNFIFLFLAIASIIINIYLSKKTRETEMRLHLVSDLTNQSLHDFDELKEIKKTIESIDRVFDREGFSRQILDIRDKLEHRIRRISLFTKDRQLVSGSLLWFSENLDSDDITYIECALKFKYLQDKTNRELAERIVRNRISK
jgi:hypothetical protein